MLQKNGVYYFMDFHCKNYNNSTMFLHKAQSVYTCTQHFAIDY